MVLWVSFLSVHFSTVRVCTFVCLGVFMYVHFYLLVYVCAHTCWSSLRRYSDVAGCQAVSLLYQSLSLYSSSSTECRPGFKYYLSSFKYFWAFPFVYLSARWAGFAAWLFFIGTLSHASYKKKDRKMIWNDLNPGLTDCYVCLPFTPALLPVPPLFSLFLPLPLTPVLLPAPSPCSLPFPDQGWEPCCSSQSRYRVGTVRHIHSHRQTVNMGQLLSWIRAPRDNQALQDVAVEQQVSFHNATLLTG